MKIEEGNVAGLRNKQARWHDCHTLNSGAELPEEKEEALRLITSLLLAALPSLTSCAALSAVLLLLWPVTGIPRLAALSARVGIASTSALGWPPALRKELFDNLVS